MDDLVERVARALSVPEHHTGWRYLSGQEKNLYRMQAEYALKEITATRSGDKERARMAYKTGYQEGVADADGLFCRDACEEGWQQYSERSNAL